MNQALYAHMNNKRKMKKKKEIYRANANQNKGWMVAFISDKVNFRAKENTRMREEHFMTNIST
jgi:hypothetical protein